MKKRIIFFLIIIAACNNIYSSYKVDLKKLQTTDVKKIIESSQKTKFLYHVGHLNKYNFDNLHKQQFEAILFHPLMEKDYEHLKAIYKTLDNNSKKEFLDFIKQFDKSFIATIDVEDMDLD